MGKPFKDKLKNVGDFISGTIAEVEKQAKDSEVLDKIRERKMVLCSYQTE